MGRDAKPVEILVLENKKHLTKAEIEERKQQEIKIGDNKAPLICPDYVREDLTALKKWKECKKIYEASKSVELVSDGDVGLIGRYCKTYSEYLDLVKWREQISDIEFNSEEEDSFYDVSIEVANYRRAKGFWTKLDFIASLNGIMALDKAINQKLSVLSAMEDRLYLNPLSKARNILKGKLPPKKTKKENPVDKFNL